ncbi:hypothetical protein [Streptomyces adelaidensis]|uniref:hypothetical protein n=1 Tax=Streptomyces adelaidensis TaxID=2796465 RepID=UPI00190728D9|nr:hypothetical protein [Streptomyces adelaidensis]
MTTTDRATGGRPDAERQRLAEAEAEVATVAWRRWGPYLSERQWGTVRGDYSSDGEDDVRRRLSARRVRLRHVRRQLGADDWRRGGRDSLKPMDGDREEPLS